MTSPHQDHAVIWIDDRDARIIRFSPGPAADGEALRPLHAPRHFHVKTDDASGKAAGDPSELYRDIVKAVAGARAVLITGPSSAKTEFVKFLHRHAPDLFERVGGIETLARVTDRQLIAEGRRYFARSEQFRSRIA